MESGPVGGIIAAAEISGNLDYKKVLAFDMGGTTAKVRLVQNSEPSIAQGYELEVITMVVLGGVSILGGAGSILGVVLAAFIMGLVTFGLGLLNVPGIVMSIFIGLLLIIVIALPIVWRRLRGGR